MSVQLIGGSTGGTTTVTSSTTTTTKASTPSSTTTTKASTTGATTDPVTLSPQALALSRLQAMNAAANGTAPAAPVAKTKEEVEAETSFKKAAGKFLADSLGIDSQQLGDVELNDNAMRYIVRNTIIGALAPASLRRDLGLDMAGHLPKGGWGGSAGDAKLAEVTLKAKVVDPRYPPPPPLAHIAFNPAAMEEVGRMPQKKKDSDHDGMYTGLDLLPGMHALKSGESIRGAKAFTTFDEKSAGADGTEPYRRATLEDGLHRTYLMARTRNDLHVSTMATAQLAFSLTQFTRDRKSVV